MRTVVCVVLLLFFVFDQVGAQRWRFTSTMISPTSSKVPSSQRFGQSSTAQDRPKVSTVVATPNASTSVMIAYPSAGPSSKVPTSIGSTVPLSSCQTSSKYVSSQVNCFNTTYKSVMTTVPSSSCQTGSDPWGWGGAWTSCFSNVMPVSVAVSMSSCQTNAEYWTSWVVCSDIVATKTSSPVVIPATRNATTQPPTFQTPMKPLTPTVDTAPSENSMYPYGPKQNDKVFRLEDSPYYYGDHCLRINADWTGFPFFAGRHYKLHICRNGIIQLNYEWSWWWPRKFGVYWWLKNMAVIAPFWATTDTYYAFRYGHSKVYYQVYKPKEKGNSSAILEMATDHVQRYTGKFDNFKATWVLVVTWEKLCPYVYYRYSNRFCKESNTFQAVLITNGFHTFLMYNYPYGGIQWVVPVNRYYYRYWTNYYGLPVGGWNAGDDGKSYLNIKGSGTLYGMYNLDKKTGNTGLLGRHFWRIDNSNVKNALEKCISWSALQKKVNVHEWYDKLIRYDWEMACPCTEWQAWLDRGRFSWNWWDSWPDYCYQSRRSKFIPYFNNGIGLGGFRLRQKCCYSTRWEDWGSLKIGAPDGGRVQVTPVYEWYNNAGEIEKVYTDKEAYRYCCVDAPLCDMFYFYRPSDSCSLYRPPPRRSFCCDPHIKTLDGGNYTFNGLGEYVMIDAQDGTFQLQARTKLAQGNSTIATIFSAGAAKEENTSTIEVQVKKGGGLNILIDGETYNGYNNLTNQTIEVGRNLFISKPEENCLEVSFPSTMSVKFCEKKEMMSFVVTPAGDYKNATKGLLGTWNDDPDDDFILPDGTVLSSSSSLKEIHFGFGVKWQINQSQSLFTYTHNESVETFSKPDFEPMFADNITWADDSIKQKAVDQCGDDYECLFDVASTNDLSVGMATKDINIQLVNETNKLDNFPPKIVNTSNVINATLGETVYLSVTAVDNDTVTFRVINMPAGATVNQSGNVFYFTWHVTSSEKFNLSFVATDDKGASATWNPTINMCACEHGGQCVKPEEGDSVNTDSKFVYMGCACQGGYTGRFCDSDIDACELNGQPCYTGVECIDLPPPANSSGYECGPCPSGYTGNGAQCVDFDECQSDSSNICQQFCVNVPASYFCDCDDGYQLNADGKSCDDIDECEPTSDCMQNCINSVGSYNCSCNQFFKPDATDWRKCVATNPCDSNHGCQHVCFKGNNNQATCACFANYELQSDGKTCKDIDECDPANPQHRCSQSCENTPGSYNCLCEKGFELNKNGYECEDVNECLDEDLYNCTDEFHKCVNTRGSYKCECEQDLYFINGTCRGLEKNETAPKPDLPEPRVPSNKEKKEAVQFSITSTTSEFEWDFDKDKSFKENVASVTWDYCTNNRTRCALKETRRNRRSPLSDLYTADQTHLLPGYPSNASGSLQVAFYVQQPLGLFIGNFSVLPRDTLIHIVTTQKSVLEEAIGANISDIKAWYKPPTPTTAPGPVEPESTSWKWIVIGICVGVFFIGFLILVIVYMCLKKSKNKKVKPEGTQTTEEQPLATAMENYDGRQVHQAWEMQSTGRETP